ncbi:MAG TPA: CehA/McbA family metallohydrolase [Kofleriaceae bacterium]|nr:CehA/McbA family metallohydrolase [Kofleriaceae bacterium]
MIRRGALPALAGPVALSVLAVAACSTDVAPRARADRISTREQLIGGPKALGEIGDFLLENDRIHVIIEDKGPGRGTTLFGGSLLDADLVRPNADGVRGNDQLSELLPTFLFEVIEPTQVTVVSDGSDGGPASVAVRGVGGDLIQSLAVLNTGLVFPPALEFEQLYSLAPGKSYVEITTTITNTSDGQHPLPFVDPPALADLGLDVPGLDQLELSVPFGHLLLFGQEQTAFAPGKAGFNLRFAVEDSYAESSGFPAFPGIVADFLASRGSGVSYGVTVPPQPSNYPSAFRELYQPQAVKPTSVLLPFVYSALTGVYTAKPPSVLEPGASFSYTTFFIIGRGDVASVADVVYRLQSTPTGVLAGRLLDAQSEQGVATSLLILAATGDDIVSQVQSDDRGAFHMTLPPGDYRYRVIDDDRPPAGPVGFTVREGQTTSVQIQVAAPARLAVIARDETGQPVPARVTVVGDFDPADAGRDPRDFLYSLAAGERTRATAFDSTSTRYIERMVPAPTGRVEAEIRPGHWDVVVTRGPEYQAATRSIDVASGAFAALDVTLERAYATDGWIAGDFHLHSINSPDSELALPDRVASLAAEGLEFAAATDHNFITDYGPTIARLGLERFISAVPGLEMTTFEMGHFNGYPLRFDPGRTRGGVFDWTGRTPQELFDQLRVDLAPTEEGAEQPIVQVNHPRDGFLGYFNAYAVDPDTGDPGIPPGLRGVFTPYGDEFQPDAFSWDFDAYELANGKRLEILHTFRAPDPLPPGDYPDPQPVAGEIVVDAEGKALFPGQVEDWFVLLDRGLRPTAMGNSDSHGILFEEPGFARSMVWVGEGKDAQGAFTTHDVMAGIRAHHVIVTNGPFIELTVEDQPAGSDVSGGAPIAKVRVRAPDWAKVDRLRLYLGGQIVSDEPIPPESATDYEVVFTLTPDRDDWVVAEATGSASMFPVLSMREFESLDADVILRALGAGIDLSALNPSGGLKPAKTFVVTPYAITNPVWIDADGDGNWEPRLPPPPARSRAHRDHAAPPDVRAVFDRLKEDVQ